MPADPKLNEKKILHVLRDKDIPVTPNGMRSLNSLVLLCCYDRKVEREFMAAMLDLVAETDIIISKIEVAVTVRHLYGVVKPDSSTEQIDKQVNDLMVEFGGARACIAEKFDLVTQCPTLTDKIS